MVIVMKLKSSYQAVSKTNGWTTCKCTCNQQSSEQDDETISPPLYVSMLNEIT